MILPAHDLTISDGDRFRAIFADPEATTERLAQIADELGVDTASLPPTQILDCVRVLCDTLIKEQRAQEAAQPC